MIKEIHEIDKIYEEILSHKKYIFEQINQSFNIFGNSTFTIDDNMTGIQNPDGWKSGFKFVSETGGSILSPIQGKILKTGNLGQKYYVYLETIDKKNQIYISYLDALSFGLSENQEISAGREIGKINAKSYVYITSNPTSISSFIDNKGNTKTGTGSTNLDSSDPYLNPTAVAVANSMKGKLQEQIRGRGREQIRGRGGDERRNQTTNDGQVIFSSGISQEVNDTLRRKLDKIASDYGKTITITSAQRDPKRNKKVGGVKNSAHLRANAVDIALPDSDEDDTNNFIRIASQNGIGGIGVYRPGVVHLDVEGRRAWGPTHRRSSVPSWAESAIQSHLSSNTSYVPVFSSDEPDDTDIDVENQGDGLDEKAKKLMDEIIDRISLSNLSDAEKAEAIKKIKKVAEVGGIAGLYVILDKLLKGVAKPLTSDSDTPTKTDIYTNPTADYIANFIKLALPG